MNPRLEGVKEDTGESSSEEGGSRRREARTLRRCTPRPQNCHSPSSETMTSPREDKLASGGTGSRLVCAFCG